MDSYEILNVTRESSDREIEISYEDLKRKYDPSFNTSTRAYTKYREVLKAYEDIKNEKRRIMYDLKDNSEDKLIINKEYKLFDFNKEIIKKEECVDFSRIEEVKDVIKEDIVIDKKISYLYYLLNLKTDIEYSKRVNCDECSSFVMCDVCAGKGVVYYKENQVFCPVCHGKGEVSSVCQKCGNDGSYTKKEIVSVLVENETMILNDLGDEYYDFSKSNLVINFDFYDKDDIKVSTNEIYINYYLSKEETLNGLSKEFYSENGAFKIEIPSFVDNGYKQEVIFNNQKLIFSFYNEKINGLDKEYYLFVNKDYKAKPVYFNEDYSKCSFVESEEYFNSLVLDTRVVLEGLGETGKYGGNNGSLIINCIFNNSKSIEYVSDVIKLETNRLFNLLGGKYKDFKHYGFKRENSLVEYKDKYYFLTGKNNLKCKLKEYYLFKIVSLVIFAMLPLLVFVIPYGETMFWTLIGSLVGYFILINLLMEVNV